MGKSLVIVESPAKAKTINKYLGKDFIVKSSIGHIRDLPSSGSAKSTMDPSARAKLAAEERKLPAEERNKRKQERANAALIQRMGVDPEHGWKARYEIMPGKEKVVSELQKLAKSADAVYLATDLDREGEAIAWHLTQAIGGEPERYKRVVFNEITQKAIQEAFSHPGELNTDQVNAQQARRFSTAWWATCSRLCCGKSWPAACPPAACSPSPCVWWSNASARSTPSSPRNIGRSSPTCTRRTANPCACRW